MLPNVCSKPMAEVLGPPVFLFKGRLRRRETKNQSAGFLPNPERAYLERPRHKQSWDKSNILSFISKSLWRDHRSYPGNSPAGPHNDGVRW